MKEKTYDLMGYLYVPVDMKIKAKSKKEAKQKYIDYCNKQTFGFDADPYVTDVQINTEGFSFEEDIIVTINDYLF